MSNFNKSHKNVITGKSKICIAFAKKNNIPCTDLKSSKVSLSDLKSILISE